MSNVDIAIGVEGGMVIAKWQELANHIVFDPSNAYQIGTAMAKAAMEASRGVAQKGDLQFVENELREMKVVVSDLQRMGMVMQVATIVRTMIDEKRTPGTIAQHCVDIVLRETAR